MVRYASSFDPAGAPEPVSGTQRISRTQLRSRVLLVDDEELTLKGLRRVMEYFGYQVVATTSADEALERLMDESFDVVITDIGMPEVGGLTLLRLIHEHAPLLPVVLMTGSPDVGSAISAIEHGAFHYLPKPTSMESLQQVLTRALATRQTLQLERELEGDLNQPPTQELRFEQALRTSYVSSTPIVTAGGHALFGYSTELCSAELDFERPGALHACAEGFGRRKAVGRVMRHRVATWLRQVVRDRATTVIVPTEDTDLDDPLLVATHTSFAEHAARIVLELSVPTGHASPEALKPRLAELREFGYRMALGDLASGYSALTSLALIEPEIVKVDASLVRGIHMDHKKQKLFRSIASLCRDLGTTLVAGGVSTPEEEQMLEQLGCDLLQGELYEKAGA